MRLIDAEPIERALFRRADKSLAKNPYENAKICAFRRAFELIIDAPTIASLPNDAPPNDPLTLEQLREMDGDPVWLEWGGHPQAGWALVRVWSKANNVIYLTYHNGNTDLLGYVLADGGKIYRRRPEEEPI